MARDNKVTLDVTQQRKPAPKVGGKTPAAMALRFSGGVEGITAPPDLDQRVIVVLDTTIGSLNYHTKKSDKAKVLEAAFSCRVDEGWVLDAEAGLSLVEALRIAREDVVSDPAFSIDEEGD